MSKAVTVSAEVAITRVNPESGKRQILLTLRDDQYYGKGWHIPGGFIGPGESRQETVERIASREIRIKPTFRQIIKPFFHDDDPRFYHVALIFECYYEGEGAVSAGEWFDAMPQDIITAHEKYRAVVAEMLARW
jgi:colanic acid biosynthesis protein WcaH